MPTKNKASSKRRSKLQRRYNSTPAQIKRRTKRTLDRRKAIKEGRVKKGDKRDLHHSNRKTLSGKTTVQSASKNRANNSQFAKRRRKRRKSP